MRGDYVGSRSLSRSNLNFLDSWEPTASQGPQAAEIREPAELISKSKSQSFDRGANIQESAELVSGVKCSVEDELSHAPPPPPEPG